MSKVLIIKDNNDPSSQFLPSVFDRLGYETICIDTVGDAGRYISDVDIHAVFVDIDAVTDDSALEALIQEAKPYKMVVLYGTEKKKDLICRAFELNIDDFIRKPIDEIIFESKIKCVFERFNQLRHFHNTNLEVFLDTMPAMMAITDDEGRILFANATFCNKYNIEKEDAFNKFLCDILCCQNFLEDGGRCTQNCEFCKLYEFATTVFSTGKRILRKMYSFPQMQRDGRITSYDWSRYDTRTVVYKTIGLSAEELKNGYDWAYHEFYTWSNIFKSSFGHDNLKQQLAHLAYMGGWKKFEPFWNFMIQYGALNRMLPMLEHLLANTHGSKTKKAHSSHLAPA
jgi:PAS domain-containing protein